MLCSRNVRDCERLDVRQKLSQSVQFVCLTEMSPPWGVMLSLVHMSSSSSLHPCRQKRHHSWCNCHHHTCTLYLPIWNANQKLHCFQLLRCQLRPCSSLAVLVLQCAPGNYDLKTSTSSNSIDMQQLCIMKAKPFLQCLWASRKGYIHNMSKMCLHCLTLHVALSYFELPKHKNRTTQ